MCCVIVQRRVPEVRRTLSAIYLKGGHIFFAWFVGAVKTQKLYRHLLEMNNFGTDKGIVIRYPATANLLIDSYDRADSYENPWDFQIAKPESILNGFFTRIATSEVVLEWCQPNISPLIPNTQIAIDISGTGANTFSGVEQITMPTGFYTVAQALETLTKLLTDLSGTTGAGFTTAISTLTNQPVIASVGAEFKVSIAGSSQLINQLGLSQATSFSAIQSIICPDLRPYRYIDFTSSQLTYNQDLKDSSTARINRDVLCRWYFSFDEPPELDSLGIPILMGYTPFKLRRLFNPPKQIRWDSAQPIGTLGFQVYGDDEQLVYYSNVYMSEWLMTLQVSEN